MSVSQLAARLPDGWSSKPLDQVADLLSGGTPPKSNAVHWSGDVPWVSPKDMKMHRLDRVADVISDEAARSYSRVVPAGSTFVVIRGMILAKDIPVCLATRPMAFNQDVKAIVPKEGIDGEFLSFAIASRKPALAMDIGTAAHGTRRISSSALEQLEVPVPDDLREQQAIARILSSLLRRCEIESERAGALRSLKAATMAKLFRDGLRGESSEMTELGQIPATWRTVKLGDREFCTTTSGGTPSRADRTMFGGGIPWVKSGELGDGIVEKTEETLSEKGLRESSAKIIPEGTLLVAMYGATAGATGILARPAATNQAVCALSPVGGSFDPEFLRHYLILRRRALLAARHGGAQPNLSQQILRGLSVAVPSSIDEQVEIGARLSALSAAVGRAETRSRILRRLFDATLASLMTGRMRLQDGARDERH